ERAARAPLLGDAATFAPAGPAVPSWFRTVGFVLSTSDDESFHLAPAEGMASRAVPAIHNWPGAGEIYPREFVHSTQGEAARAILEVAGSGSWRELGERGQRFVDERYRLETILARWEALILDGAPGAAAPAA